MKPIISVNTKKFERYLKEQNFSTQELLDIRGAGARVIINNQRTLVPKASTATQQSINSHIIEATATRVEDEVGAETLYAPYIEYGTGIYAEAGDGRKGGWRYKDTKGNWHFTLGMKPQPFIRPSIEGSNGKEVMSALTAAFELTIAGKKNG